MQGVSLNQNQHGSSRPVGQSIFGGIGHPAIFEIGKMIQTGFVRTENTTSSSYFFLPHFGLRAMMVPSLSPVRSAHGYKTNLQKRAKTTNQI